MYNTLKFGSAEERKTLVNIWTSRVNSYENILLVLLITLESWILNNSLMYDLYYVISYEKLIGYGFDIYLSTTITKPKTSYKTGIFIHLCAG